VRYAGRRLLKAHTAFPTLFSAMLAVATRGARFARIASGAGRHRMRARCRRRNGQERTQSENLHRQNRIA
jgi:hypothetical protein